jgi:predicted DNA binding protein
LLAYERGFFDIPRRATAADLAAELDVSRQAVSERLRRGYAALVETHVR